MKLDALLARVRAVADLVNAQDVLTFGGLAALCVGLAQVDAALAWSVGGIACMWLGLRGGR